MKQSTKLIALVYVLFVIIKILLSFSSLTLSIYSDEYIYLKLAQSVSEGSYSIHGVASNAYPPLYPFIISPAQWITNTQWSYIITKIINVFISTIIIFPSFFILKKFLTEKQSVLGASIAALHPSVFAFTPYIMSENLFYTLVLCTILLMINAIKTQKISLHLLTGIALGAVFLTRTLGLLFVPVYIVAQFTHMMRGEKRAIKKHVMNAIMVMCLASILMISWMAYNLSFSSEKPLGAYTQEVLPPDIRFLPQMALWVILYASVLIISTGIIFPAAVYAFVKNTKTEEGKILASIIVTALIMFIIAGANHSIHSNIKSSLTWILGRPIGRYIDALAVPILLTGFIGLIKNEKKEMMKPLVVCSMLALISIPILIHFSIGPVNNISLTFFEGLKRTIEGGVAETPSFLTLGLATAIMGGWIISLMMTEKKKMLLTITLIFFILTSGAAFAGTYYNTKIWDNHPQIKLSKWIHENIQQGDTIAIDKTDCKKGDIKKDIRILCDPEGRSTVIGTVIRNKIVITQKVEGNYFISTQDINLPKVKEESGIKVYKNI